MIWTGVSPRDWGCSSWEWSIVIITPSQNKGSTQWSYWLGGRAQWIMHKLQIILKAGDNGAGLSCIITFNPCIASMRSIITMFYRWGNQGTVGLNKLPKVTWQWSDRLWPVWLHVQTNSHGVTGRETQRWSPGFSKAGYMMVLLSEVYGKQEEGQV